MNSLTADINLSIATIAQLSSAPYVATQNFTFAFLQSLVNGVGVDACNLISSWQYTFAPSESKEWVIGSGSTIVDPFGATARFRSVRAFVCRSYSKTPVNGINLEKTASDTRFFLSNVADSAGKYTLRPGGLLCLIAPDDLGYDIDVATACLGFKATNMDSSNPQTVDFLIIGEAH